VIHYLVQARRRHVQMVTGRKPRRRRMPRALHPTAVGVGYTRTLLDLVRAMRDAARRALYPAIQRHVQAARELSVRTDAVDDDVASLLSVLERGSFQKGHLKALVTPVANRTADWHREQLARQLRTAVGVEVPIGDPQLGKRIEQFTDANVALIRTIPQQSLAQVQQVVLQGLADGDRWETLSEAIEQRFNVAESRAALIARDQVGKFYANLNEVRQKDLGLTHFIWATAADERLCPVCAPLDGKRFAWDKPPAVGAPGEVHPNCRCYADPDVSGLLDSLEGKAPAEEPKEPRVPPKPELPPVKVQGPAAQEAVQLAPQAAGIFGEKLWVEPQASGRHVAAVEALEGLPAAALQKVADAGITISIGDGGVVAVDAAAGRGVFRPGQKTFDGRSWNVVEGAYSPGQKAMMVADGHTPEWTAHVTRHEFGHALDDALQRASTGADFRQAHAAWVKSTEGRKSYNSYFTHHFHGASETFAEAYAFLLHPQRGAAWVDLRFSPGIRVALEALLRKAGVR
jgi:SPP1 gp7 family putative phage head morphogenesis protein